MAATASCHLPGSGAFVILVPTNKIKIMELNAMDLLMKEAPGVAKAFDGLIQSLVASEGLDAKTKQLIYIAMKTAMGDDMAVKFHAPMAKQLGATKPEIIDALLLSLTVSGISGVLACLPAVVQLFEGEDKGQPH